MLLDTLLSAAPRGRDRRIVLGVRLGIPAEDLPIVLLEEGQDLSGPLQLSVPDTGRVAVSVSGSSGGPRSLRLGLDTGRPRRGWGWRPGVRELHSASNRVIIDKVGLGLSLRLEVEDLSGEMAIESRTFPGPRVAGETVEVEVAFTDRRPVLKGRVAQQRCKTKPVSDAKRCWKRRFECPGPVTYSLDLSLLWRKRDLEAPRRGRRQSWGTHEVIRSKEITIPAGQYLTEIAIPMPPEAIEEALRLAGEQ